ncbi:MAG TPA: hypothetical protein VJV79_03950 [Polyangiaceae bacterium]|nr:hypothetical protein [Polyangiaceae bacterium]
MTIPEARAARGLRADARGAILVLGVFMCACMAGALWYVIGIGDAILYRERLQEGADAVAFSAAALDARGMNLIVLLNLLMACVLGVRVAMKAAQASLVVIGGICAIFPPLAGLSTTCFEMAGQLQTAIVETRPAINQTLKALSRAQVGIKIMVPAAALAGSIQVGSKFRPRVSEAGAANRTLIQGLPVDEGSLDQLCREAGESGPRLLEWMIESITRTTIPDRVTSRFHHLIGKGIEKGGAYFCELGSGAGTPPDFGSELDSAAKEGCDEEIGGLKSKAQQARSDHQRTCRSYGAACGGGSDKALSSAQMSELSRLQAQQSNAESAVAGFDDKKCKSDKRNQADQRMKGQGGGTQSPVNSGRDMTPKQVSARYLNGGDDAQLLSVAKGNTAALRVAPRGVRIGAWSKQGGDARPLTDSFAFAQAEFFYDCAGAWRSENCNGSKPDEGYAMWHFRWRARLRRYNSGNNPGIDQLANVIAGADLLKEGMSRLPKLNWSTDENALLLKDLGHAVQRDVIVH